MTNTDWLYEILDTVYMNGVKSAEKGIYIPLPNPKAKQAITDKILEAIGGDEKIRKWDDGGILINDEPKEARNQLRKEIRDRLGLK